MQQAGHLDRRRSAARWLLAALAIFASLVGAAAAGDATLGDLTITQPWTRATAARTPTGAGYMTIVNSGTTADRLVGAATTVARAAHLHTVRMEEGVARMRPVAAIDVPAGGSAELKPGGFHLMLIDLVAPLRQGTTVPLTLTFEKAGEVTVELVVHGAGARQPGGHGAGHGGGHGMRREMPARQHQHR